MSGGCDRCGCGCCYCRPVPMPTLVPTLTPSRRDGTCPKIEAGFASASWGWSGTSRCWGYCGRCHCPEASLDSHCCRNPYRRSLSLGGRSEETGEGTPGSAYRTAPRGWCYLRYWSEFAPSGERMQYVKSCLRGKIHKSNQLCRRLLSTWPAFGACRRHCSCLSVMASWLRSCLVKSGLSVVRSATALLAWVRSNRQQTCREMPGFVYAESPRPS